MGDLEKFFKNFLASTGCAPTPQRTASRQQKATAQRTSSSLPRNDPGRVCRPAAGGRGGRVAGTSTTGDRRPTAERKDRGRCRRCREPPRQCLRPSRGGFEAVCCATGTSTTEHGQPTADRKDLGRRRRCQEPPRQCLQELRSLRGGCAQPHRDHRTERRRQHRIGPRRPRAQRQRR